MAQKSYTVIGAVAVAELEGGASRYLYKGSTLPEGVTNIDHLKAVGLITEVEDVVVPEPTEASVKSVDDMRVDELKAYAAEKDINLGDAKTKDAILTAIRAAEVTGGQSA